MITFIEITTPTFYCDFTYFFEKLLSYTYIKIYIKCVYLHFICAVTYMFTCTGHAVYNYTVRRQSMQL